MASAIDPDKKPKRAATTGVRRPVPAVEPEPVKPAAAARSGVPRPAAKAAAARRRTDDEPEPDAEEPTVGATLLKQTPAWAVSLVVHVVALLAMALIVTEPPKKEAAVSIVASAPDEEETFEEFEEGAPDGPVDATDPVADVAIPTDVVIEDVKVVSDAQDVDAAPLSVDITEFSDITAAATDMLSTIGVVGATGKGFGGRRNAAGLAGAGGGGNDTEDAVDRALRWFIEHQLDDGSWDFDLNKCPGCQGKCSNIDSPSERPGQQADRTAATALALLPFLGRGYTHRDGNRYQRQIEKGILYLATLSEKNKGQCYAEPAGMYSQGIATIALTEAYAMTQDDRLETPAQLALNFIEKAQYPDGGWKYRSDPATPEGDTSVTVWQFMALKSGNMAQLKISGGTIKNVLRFLDSVEDDGGAQYRYQTGEITLRSATAMGLLCRMYSGWDQDNPVLARGVKYLAEKGPTADLYYSYYATQVMHHYGGDAWKEWNAKMKDLLLKRQATEGHAAGSWYEYGSESLFKDQGTSAAGRLYCTSMATMMLEVYYRHLPIYGTGATRGNAN